MNSHENPPPDRPARGLLFLLDEEWADLIPQEHRFSENLAKAHEEGRLYAPPEARLH
jgi:hypothetical protein